MRTPANMQLYAAHDQAFATTIASAMAYRELRELLAEPEMEVLPEDLQAFYDEYIARRTIVIQAFNTDIAAIDALYQATIQAVRDGTLAIWNPAKEQAAIQMPAAIPKRQIGSQQAPPAPQPGAPYSINLDALPDEAADQAAPAAGRKVYSQKWQEAVGIGEDILRDLPELPDAAADFAESVQARVADQIEWIQENRRVTDKMLTSLERTAKGVARWLKGRDDDD